MSTATLGLPAMGQAQPLPPVGSIIVETLDGQSMAALKNGESVRVRIKAFDQFGNAIPGCQPNLAAIQGVGNPQLLDPVRDPADPSVFTVTATQGGFGSAELLASCAHDANYAHKPQPVSVMRDFARPTTPAQPAAAPSGGGGGALLLGLGVAAAAAVAVGAAASSTTTTTSSGGGGSTSNCPTGSCSGGGGFCAVPNNCPCPAGSSTAGPCPANFGGTPSGTRHCNCN